MSKSRFIKKGIGIAIMIVICIFLLSAVVMFLWNHILVPVLNINVITIWQALGIFILSKILFGGFKGKGGRCGESKGKGRMMMENWHNMSPEEKDAFKEKLRSRCRSWRQEKNTPPPTDNSVSDESNSANA